MKSTWRTIAGFLSHVPGVGVADRLADRGPRTVELLPKILDAEFTAQQHLIADDHARDVVILARQRDAGAHLELVLVEVLGELDAERDADVMPAASSGTLPSEPSTE